MIKEAIDKVISLAQDLPIEIDDRKYWGKTGSPIKPPIISPVGDLYSLDGLLSVLRAPEITSIDNYENIQIVVASPTQVLICSGSDTLWCQRDIFAIATHRSRTFPFGEQLDIETFIIKVQCLFQETDMKKKLISHVSSICAEEAVVTKNDGISQEVVVKSGIRRDRETISPILDLRPYRTFPEVEQPDSKFLLRISKERDGTLVAALFEADGGLWQTRACANIAAYIRSDEIVKKHKIAVIG